MINKFLDAAVGVIVSFIVLATIAVIVSPNARFVEMINELFRIAHDVIKVIVSPITARATGLSSVPENMYQTPFSFGTAVAPDDWSNLAGAPASNPIPYLNNPFTLH